ELVVHPALGLELFLVGIPGDRHVTSDVALAGQPVALVEQLAETVALAPAWRGEVLETGLDTDAVGPAVATRALERDPTLVADGDAEEVDLVAIRELDHPVGGREADARHRRVRRAPARGRRRSPRG